MSAVPGKEKKRFSYFREVKHELAKVTWTPRGELWLCAKIVVVATFIFGFAIYLVDLSIRALLESIGSLMRMVFFR